MGIKWRRFWVQPTQFKWFLFEPQKYFFVLQSRVFFFFQMAIFTTLFDVAQRYENRRWKWQRCFDIVYCCSNQCWNRQCWFDVIQRLKLLRWFLVMRYHIKLKTTLKQRWKICRSEILTYTSSIFDSLGILYPIILELNWILQNL